MLPLGHGTPVFGQPRFLFKDMEWSGELSIP